MVKTVLFTKKELAWLPSRRYLTLWPREPTRLSRSALWLSVTMKPRPLCLQAVRKQREAAHRHAAPLSHKVHKVPILIKREKVLFLTAVYRGTFLVSVYHATLLVMTSYLIWSLVWVTLRPNVKMFYTSDFHLNCVFVYVVGREEMGATVINAVTLWLLLIQPLFLLFFQVQDCHVIKHLSKEEFDGHTAALVVGGKNVSPFNVRASSSYI